MASIEGPISGDHKGYPTKLPKISKLASNDTLDPLKSQAMIDALTFRICTGIRVGIICMGSLRF